MSRKLLFTLLAAMPLSLAGCGGGDSPVGSRINPPTTLGCTVQERNKAVYDLMQDAYYWYEHVPDVDLSKYSSPQALLDDIRYKPLDTTFSYLTTVKAEDDFLNNATYFGFGFSMTQSGSRVFLRESFPGSPAHEAGMRRGDEIIAIDGASVASLIASGQFNNAFGPDEQGYTVEFEILPAGETETDVVEVSKDEVTLPVVGANHADFEVNGEAVGYIFFRSFVNPAFNQLDAAFANLNENGVSKLILDLRYNGGGLLSVAEHLGSLVAGDTLEGTLLAEIEFNDRYTHLNDPYFIEKLQNSVGITDLVVITTGATASASEMIINGLQPHMNVTVIGDNTYGKPVGQSRLEYCQTEILRAVTFKVVNSEGEGEYFPPLGIPPDCTANDDIFNPLGDAGEASVAEALNYLATGSCSGTASMKAMQDLARQKAGFPDGDPLVRDGWDVLTGGVR